MHELHYVDDDFEEVVDLSDIKRNEWRHASEDVGSQNGGGAPDEDAVAAMIAEEYGGGGRRRDTKAESALNGMERVCGSGRVMCYGKQTTHEHPPHHPHGLNHGPAHDARNYCSGLLGAAGGAQSQLWCSKSLLRLAGSRLLRLTLGPARRHLWRSNSIRGCCARCHR